MRKKQRKAKFIFTTFIILCNISLLSGCNQKKNLNSTQQENSPTVAEGTSANNESFPSPTMLSSSETENFLLPEVFPMEFVFASGAGAWETVFTLYQDGSLEGNYHDSEMGEQGEGYPHGTIYTSDFQGSFYDISQINDYTYSMTLDEVIIQDEENKEWIEDKIRYVTVKPYGLENGKEFLLYTPDTPLEELSEDFLSWWPDNYLREENSLATLGCYGIYNKEMKYGFFSSKSSMDMGKIRNSLYYIIKG